MHIKKRFYIHLYPLPHLIHPPFAPLIHYIHFFVVSQLQIDYDESNRVDLHPDEMMMEEDYEGISSVFEYVFMFTYM